MGFFTVGIHHYPGYICHLHVSQNTESLKKTEADEYYKFIYIETGTCRLSINGQEYILTGAHALYLNEQDHAEFCSSLEKSPVILFFKPYVINSRFDFLTCDSPDNLTLSENQDREYLVNFRHGREASSKIEMLNAINSAIVAQKLLQLNDQLLSQNTSYWPCRSRACLLEILFSLIRPEEINDVSCPAQTLSGYSRLTVEVLYYLQSSYSRKITIQSLAHDFGTNRTTLLFEFKKNTGMSVNRYLTQLRMTIATALLRDTELSINEICERTGFQDISYFSKSFKKQLSFTPSEYRHISAS